MHDLAFVHGAGGKFSFAWVMPLSAQKLGHAPLAKDVRAPKRLVHPLAPPRSFLAHCALRVHILNLPALHLDASTQAARVIREEQPVAPIEGQAQQKDEDTKLLDLQRKLLDYVQAVHILLPHIREERSRRVDHAHCARCKYSLQQLQGKKDQTLNTQRNLCEFEAWTKSI